MSQDQDQEIEEARPRRRRHDHSALASWQGKVIVALLALLSTAFTGYSTALVAIGDRERALLERIAAVEARQATQFEALSQRIDDLRDDARTAKGEIRADINGTREEIMRILRAIPQ